jgi:hypothetical protein
VKFFKLGSNIMTNKLFALLAAAPLVFIDGLHLRTKSNTHNVNLAKEAISANSTATTSAAAAEFSSSLIVGFDEKTRTPVFETS